jgi:hypothetical protein
MEKINKKIFEPLDQEEKDLMESIERDEWHPGFKIVLESIFVFV